MVSTSLRFEPMDFKTRLPALDRGQTVLVLSGFLRTGIGSKAHPFVSPVMGQGPLESRTNHWILAVQ